MYIATITIKKYADAKEFALVTSYKKMGVNWYRQGTDDIYARQRAARLCNNAEIIIANDNVATFALAA